MDRPCRWASVPPSKFISLLRERSSCGMRWTYGIWHSRTRQDFLDSKLWACRVGASLSSHRYVCGAGIFNCTPLSLTSIQRICYFDWWNIMTWFHYLREPYRRSLYVNAQRNAFSSEILTRFHSRTSPNISVLDYLRRIVQYTKVEVIYQSHTSNY